jgi:hypothetical protein
MRFYILTISLLLLSACTSIQKIETAYNKSSQARIRVIKSATFRFYPDQTCSSPTLLGIGDKGYVASGKYEILDISKSIGMPLLKDTPLRYNEHVVEANQNLTIDAYRIQQIGNTQLTCGPVVGTFIPSAGEDYEVNLVSTGKGCRLNIRNILSEDGGYKSEPVRFKPSSRCSFNPFVK